MITPMITPIATARHPLTPASGTLVSEDLGSGDLPPPPSAPPAASMPAIELPAGWQCESSRYGGSDGCDCACGAYDPDCAAVDAYGRPMLGAWGCAAGEPCLPPGVCGGRPAVALFPGGGLELRSAAGLSAPSRAVAPAPVDATVPAIASFVAADPDNGDSAISNPNPSPKPSPNPNPKYAPYPNPNPTANQATRRSQ